MRSFTLSFRNYGAFILLILGFTPTFSQTKAVQDAAVPCVDDADADRLPGKYYDHTRPKYPMSLKADSPQEKTAMLSQLIALEKLEEKSRSNFVVNGCVLRTSFSNLSKTFFGNYYHASYEYQLAAYANVCHVREHVVKTVGEYRTVIRVAVNPSIDGLMLFGGNSDFYITDKSVRYDIPIDAEMNKRSAGYLTKNPGSRISQYFLMDKSTTNMDDFDKINNGKGYVEEVMQGSDPKQYQWLNRHWYITKTGMPLLVTVTRKEYLEALLEFYELERINFLTMMGFKKQDDERSTSEEAKKRLSTYDMDKSAYEKIYSTKKSKVSQILASQNADWLKQPAVVGPDRFLRPNDYTKASNGLLDFERFYDNEPKNLAIYQYNPAYFKNNQQQPIKPLFMRIQFRYEMGKGYSERLFDNFQKNYDMEALRKMLE